MGGLPLRMPGPLVVVLAPRRNRSLVTMTDHALRAALVSALIAAAACGSPAPSDYATAVQDPELLHGSVLATTDAMVQSITSPPVASRTYAYASIAAYEALRPGHPGYASLAGQVRGLEPVPTPAPEAGVSLPLASVAAFLSVAEALVFAPERVASHRDSLLDDLRRAGVPSRVTDASFEHGDRVARHVLAWAATDNIKAARAGARFVVEQEPGRWQPTQPAYMDALEPNWMMLRPFVMDSASQFRPVPPHPFDMRDGSPFHRELMEVYEVGRTLTPEQKLIAAFWDCNPYALQAQGHMMVAVKKISPGGHWMGIAGIASRESGADMMRSAEAYARVGMAIADGFISVWDEKYRSVLIRPETVIMTRLDPSWRPFLQTPPFPEYTSGHSVISAAAAEVLTDLFGDGFAFEDDVEVPYGLPARSFTSFRQAAEEAAVSRLYGGIHYRMAVENGLVQGRALGQTIIDRARFRPASLAQAPSSSGPSGPSSTDGAAAPH